MMFSDTIAADGVVRIAARTIVGIRIVDVVVWVVV